VLVGEPKLELSLDTEDQGDRACRAQAEVGQLSIQGHLLDGHVEVQLVLEDRAQATCDFVCATHRKGH